MSAPVRVALPEELQSPLYVGKLGRSVSLQERDTILDWLSKNLDNYKYIKMSIHMKKKKKMKIHVRQGHAQ